MVPPANVSGRGSFPWLETDPEPPSAAWDVNQTAVGDAEVMPRRDLSPSPPALDDDLLVGEEVHGVLTLAV